MPKIIDESALFEAVLLVFAERGYVAATTQEIARRAEVNEVTLFRRYGSKAALIQRALGDCLLSSPLSRIVASDDARADLVVIVEAYKETYRAYGGAVVTLLTEMAHHPELREAAATLTPNMMKAAAIVARHQEAGQIGPGDPLQKVVLLVAPILVGGILARSGAKLPVAVPDTARLVDCFLDGHGG